MVLYFDTRNRNAERCDVYSKILSHDMMKEKKRDDLKEIRDQEMSPSERSDGNYIYIFCRVSLAQKNPFLISQLLYY